MRIPADSFVYSWIEVSLYNIDDKTRVYIIIKDIHDKKLLEGITERFVYQDCDYFIYLDMKADSYKMFSRSDNGTPLPPTVCNTYSTEIINYANNFVVDEDVAYTIDQMNLKTIEKALEYKDEHVFYLGVKDEKRGYTRKSLKYRYYDKKNKIVLLVRNYVTDIYLAEKEKSDMLRKALEEARTDSLCRVYNRRAIELLINEKLGLGNVVNGAFYFMDIDNFKLVNDTYGHDVGDEVLKYFSKQLKAILKNNAIFGRLGGDEFVGFLMKIHQWKK